MRMLPRRASVLLTASALAGGLFALSVVPVVETTLADYARLLAAGHGEEDISTIFRLKAPLFRDTSSGD